MPSRRKDDDPEEPPENGEPAEGEDGPKRPRRRPTLGNPGADPVGIHRRYVEQRLAGGRDATPEAYEEALAQWQQLPGAVTRPPAIESGEPGAPAEPPPEDDHGRDPGTPA